ncbi:hypothetical protein X798_00757 [Onchocerca flexuosa]|uniref:G_PROTEIN_RECEP_F1_2 domain-containing protein n=1 Tax=Onchocerca flexuosa TaxID=387005 RepID=A0A238C4X4_9BILA|nr:hypothetical protein X798_00757 [Onchocerca flexuosa]
MYNITHLLFVFWIPATVIALSYIFVIFNRFPYKTCTISRISRSKRYSNLNANEQIAVTTATSTSTDAHDISIEDNPTAVALKSAVGPLTLQTLSKASKKLCT